MIKEISVHVKGISALLMHRYPMVPAPAGIEKWPVLEQAEFAAYRVPGGRELYVPAEAVRRSCVAAAIYSKGKGRASLQKAAAACVYVVPEYLLLGVTEYEVDSRRVVIKATSGAIVRHRPRLNEWRLKFALQYDDAMIGAAQIRKIVDDAGQLVGVLDFRPERKGPFGRFVVTLWKD